MPGAGSSQHSGNSNFSANAFSNGGNSNNNNNNNNVAGKYIAQYFSKEIGSNGTIGYKH